MTSATTVDLDIIEELRLRYRWARENLRAAEPTPNGDGTR